MIVQTDELLQDDGDTVFVYALSSVGVFHIAHYSVSERFENEA